MGERLPDDELRALIGSVDLVDLVGQAHDVRRAGAHHEVCCPFHQERTPSCIIYADGHYHCYGCGAHGDAMTYLRQHLGLDWDAAVAELRRRAGVIGAPRPAAEARPEARERSVWRPIVPVPERAPQRPPPAYRRGEPEAWWPYLDGQGRLLGGVARYRSESQGKVTPTWTWCEGIDARTGEPVQEWRQRRWERPYPILGQYELAQATAAAVVIVEGEKTWAAAGPLLPGMVPVAYVGGHAGWRHSDWAPLRGRRVCMWPDADQDRAKGPASFAALGQFLRDSLDCRVFWIDPWAAMGPDLADGWDLADADPGADSQRIAAAVAAAEPLRTAGDLAAAHAALPPPPPPPGRPAAVDPAPDDPDLDAALAQLPITDAGLALRLWRRYGDRFHWDPRRGRWLIWDGICWRWDESGQMARWALATIDAMHREAQHAPDHIPIGKYHEKARQSASRRTRLGMVQDVMAFGGVTIVDHDSWGGDPHLLTTPSGTLDLRSGALRAPARDDRIWACTAAPYVAGATSPVLDRVLRGLCGDDQELARTLRMACGSALILGNLSERVYLMTGAGGSGKSSLFGAIAKVLGRDYARSAAMQTFQESRSEKIRSDIARLDGPRFVYADDTRDGVVLDEGTIKMLSGRSTVVARFLNQNEFEFQPRFTPFLIMNGPPQIRADTGIMRRVVRLDFPHTVPESERSDAIKTELQDPARSGPAILAWLVAGARDYLATRGAIPARFVEDSRQTLIGGDHLASWAQEYLIADASGMVPVRTLRSVYEQHCEAEGIRPVSGQLLNRTIENMGGKRTTKRASGVVAKVWQGIRIDQEAADALLPLPPETTIPGRSHTHAHTQAGAPTRARPVSFLSSVSDIGESSNSGNGNTPSLPGLDLPDEEAPW